MSKKTWFIGAWEIYEDEKGGIAYNTKTGEKIPLDEWYERLRKVLRKGGNDG